MKKRKDFVRQAIRSRREIALDIWSAPDALKDILGVGGVVPQAPQTAPNPVAQTSMLEIELHEADAKANGRRFVALSRAIVSATSPRQVELRP